MVLFRSYISLPISVYLLYPLVIMGWSSTQIKQWTFSIFPHPPCGPQVSLGSWILTIKTWWNTYKKSPGKCEGSLKTNLQDFSHSYVNLRSASSSSSKLLLKCPYQFISPAASVLDKQISVFVSLCLCLFLQIFSGYLL